VKRASVRPDSFPWAAVIKTCHYPTSLHYIIKLSFVIAFIEKSQAAEIVQSSVAVCKVITVKRAI